MLFFLPRRRLIRWKENWLLYSISALFNVIIFMGVQSIGLQYLPAGLYTVIVYLQPVLVTLLAWLFLKESLTFRKAAGILIGFAGVVAVSFDGLTGKISLLGVVLAIITGFGWALGTIHIKKTKEFADEMWMVACQNMIGGFFLTAAGMATEDFSAITWSGSFILCLLYGSTLGVVLAPVLYFKLMNEGESAKVSAFTFLVPLISVMIGTLFLNEPFTISLFLGMVLIVFSIYLINKKPSAKVAVRELD